MSNTTEFLPPESCWELYEPALRRMLFNEGAEPGAINSAAEALQPIFQHHCKPVMISAQTAQEALAAVSEAMRGQILGLMTEIALRECILWRMRQLRTAAEAQGTSVRH